MQPTFDGEMVTDGDSDCHRPGRNKARQRRGETTTRRCEQWRDTNSNASAVATSTCDDHDDCHRPRHNDEARRRRGETTARRCEQGCDASCDKREQWQDVNARTMATSRRDGDCSGQDLQTRRELNTQRGQTRLKNSKTKNP